MILGEDNQLARVQNESSREWLVTSVMVAFLAYHALEPLIEPDICNITTRCLEKPPV